MCFSRRSREYGHEPAQRERAAAALRHLDRHLVVRATDAAAAHLEHRRDRLDRLLEHLGRRAARLRADLVERAVDDRLGGRLLALDHHAVDQLRDELAVVDRVGAERARLDLGATRHYAALLRAVLGAALLAVGDARGVERRADHLVAVARQILDAPAADEHDRVLLQVVPLTRECRRRPRSRSSGGRARPCAAPSSASSASSSRRACRRPAVCGAPWRCGVFVFARLDVRPLRISWLTVGMAPESRVDRYEPGSCTRRKVGTGRKPRRTEVGIVASWRRSQGAMVRQRTTRFDEPRFWPIARRRAPVRSRLGRCRAEHARPSFSALRWLSSCSPRASRGSRQRSPAQDARSSAIAAAAGADRARDGHRRSELAASLDPDERARSRTLRGRGAARRRCGADARRRGDRQAHCRDWPHAEEADRLALHTPTSTNLRAIEFVYRYRLDDVGAVSARPRSGVDVPLRGRVESRSARSPL